MATAATSESRTLRIAFLPRVCWSGERKETPHSPASSGKRLLLKQYGQPSELPVGVRSSAVHQHRIGGPSVRGRPAAERRRTAIRYAARLRISDDAGGGDGAGDDGARDDDGGDGVPGSRPTGSGGCCCANDDGTAGPSDVVDHVACRRPPAASPTVRRPPHSHLTATRLPRPSSPLRQPGSETTCASMYLRTRPLVYRPRANGTPSIQSH